ncbi:MAG: hypothetical protein OXG55_15200 [bacterium]|nr:hypothetical protein [bacterium]
MDAIVAALIGLVGMLITGGFVWLRSEIIPRLDRIEGRLDRMNERSDERFDRVDERFDRVDERFDGVGDLLRSQGERVAPLEGRDEALSGT